MAIITYVVSSLLQLLTVTYPSIPPFLLDHTDIYLLSAGLIGSVNGAESPEMQGWIKLFNLTFFVGLATAFAVMTAFGYLFPPAGLGEEAPFVEDTDDNDLADKATHEIVSAPSIKGESSYV